VSGDEMCAQILGLLELSKNSHAVYECLTESGHKVLLAKTFAEAMDVLRGGCSIDLIISDVHLENGGTVFDFLKWVKCNPSTKAVPFVLFSSQPTAVAKYLEHGLKLTARKLGAAKYISMDTFDAKDFSKQIDSLLQKQDGSNAAEVISSKLP
jgi:CheY-like chemotaxis protein